MKKIFKKFFLPIILSISIGLICGKYIYNIYEEEISKNFASSKLYLLENGEYKSYEEMRSDNSTNNYVYYKDNNLYKSVIGITKYYNNIDKIKKLYSNNIKVTEYYIPKDKINNLQEEYDKYLLNEKDIYKVKETVDNILNLYQSSNEITLVSN